jgi:hypothetical protein
MYFVPRRTVFQLYILRPPIILFRNSFSKILVVIIDKVASEKEIEKRRFQEGRLLSAESSDPAGIPLAVLNFLILLIHGPTGNGLFVNRVRLLPGHAFPAWDLPRWAGLVKPTRSWRVAKSLKSIPLLARISMIDDHFHGHAASPDTGFAFCFVGLGLQSSAASPTIYLLFLFKIGPAYILDQRASR